jgi:DNA-binding CsgD family transcriptional regulator
VVRGIRELMRSPVTTYALGAVAPDGRVEVRAHDLLPMRSDGAPAADGRPTLAGPWPRPRVWLRDMRWDGLAPEAADGSGHEAGDAIAEHLDRALALVLEGGSDYPEAALLVHLEQMGAGGGERERALLRILLPAFRAGLDAVVRAHVGRERARTLIDAMTEGMALYDLEGRLLHHNPALARLMAEESERELLVRAVTRLAVGLAELAREKGGNVQRHLRWPPGQELRTGSGRYRLSGRVLPAEAEGAPPNIMMTVVRIAHDLRGGSSISARFGLTQREAAVARLLAEGRSNAEIARELSISSHTARHHTENVLVKLGVRSRAQVAAKVLSA